MSTALFPNKDILILGESDITLLHELASDDPLGRARICMHKSRNDNIQEMLILLKNKSYLKPHRNVKFSKSYCVLLGKVALVIFNDAGNITEFIELGCDAAGMNMICRLNVNVWHTLVSLSDYSVFIETNGGPYIQNESEYADWAPTESDSHGIALFFEQCKKSSSSK
ncbi:MAG: WbuC family cupin fold metalloprotein [Dissulfurispiraceae bacterium]|jgi:cupin fold WbuC family metalloprotein|nr:WbuC family cupin fold metalloprotein [Dissulfurispiraceae bacterium]